MEFSLTDEQNLLRDSVKRFVSEEHDLNKQQEIFRTDPRFSAAHWSMFAELGWLCLIVPEQAGGLGGSAEDAAVIAEELGRGLVGAPFLSTGILGAELISQGEPTSRRDELLGAIMEGKRRLALALEESASRYGMDTISTTAQVSRSGEIVLNGQKILVQDGADADAYIVSAIEASPDGSRNLALYIVPIDAEGVEIRRYRMIDGRWAADVKLTSVHLPSSALLIPSDRASDVLERALDHARIILASEALGAMEGALEMTADYLKGRTQFGRALASFQSLQHRLSDMFVKVENARSMLYRGLSMLDADPQQRAAAVSATMITFNQASEFVGSQAIQLHGGMGMAEEYPIGHFYKRLRVIGKSYGDLSWHMNRYTQTTRMSEIQGAA
ncbi:acyl-CoA dehydrogenase family protein [Microvirga sp. M2]|uniref:acyl-CoA dehydrogenase family protein n=1 Tax=Microvirga sp. M2 TaxID=3073270 RepID=UPI0039C134BA